VCVYIYTYSVLNGTQRYDLAFPATVPGEEEQGRRRRRRRGFICI